MKIYLFGSRARGTALPKSDWDVLYYPQEGALKLGETECWEVACKAAIRKFGPSYQAVLLDICVRTTIPVNKIDLFIPTSSAQYPAIWFERKNDEICVGYMKYMPLNLIEITCGLSEVPRSSRLKRVLEKCKLLVGIPHSEVLEIAE